MAEYDISMLKSKNYSSCEFGQVTFFSRLNTVLNCIRNQIWFSNSFLFNPSISSFKEPPTKLKYKDIIWFLFSCIHGIVHFETLCPRKWKFLSLFIWQRLLHLWSVESNSHHVFTLWVDNCALRNMLFIYAHLLSHAMVQFEVLQYKTVNRIITFMR